MALALGAALISHASPELREGDAGVLALGNVNVISMAREGALLDRTIVVRGGRIAEIGPSARVVVPDGARVVDGAGEYVVPGLIDCHVHLRDKRDLGLCLTHGVTTLRNMHGTPRYLRWREAIERGDRRDPAS